LGSNRGDVHQQRQECEQRPQACPVRCGDYRSKGGQQAQAYIGDRTASRKIPIAARVAPERPATKITTGPGVIMATATASVNWRSSSQRKSCSAVQYRCAHVVAVEPATVVAAGPPGGPLGLALEPNTNPVAAQARQCQSTNQSSSPPVAVVTVPRARGGARSPGTADEERIRVACTRCDPRTGE
jgi:hypothetical protein